MYTNRRQLLIISVFGFLFFTAFSLSGCKKTTEPVEPTKTETVAGVIEQTLCPVMGNPINKELYTEYEGKKVYFCCQECQGQFEQDPDKYLSKLPQFEQ